MHNFSQEQQKVLKIIAKNNELQLRSLFNFPEEKIVLMVEQYKQRKPVINNLKDEGIEIDDLDYLIIPGRYENFYQEAVPILVHWLEEKDLPDDAKAEIVRVLVQKSISKIPAFKKIIKLLDPSNPEEKLGVMIGNAFLRWLDDEYAEEVFDLLKKENNRQNSLVLASLANLKKPENKDRATEILKGILQESQDEAVLLSAITALRKLNITETKDLIFSFVSHPNSEIRNEAKKAIAKFEKS